MFQAVWAVVAVTLAADGKLADAPPPPPGFPKFRVQEIAADLKIGYAVILEDIDGDKKPDIVVVDQHRVVWYQNPTWKVRTILRGKTKPDNVCIAAIDIDGDKLPELVVGAGWKPSDTKTPGTLQWLKRGKAIDDEWTMHEIRCDEPTVHRVKVGDLDGDGKPEIVMAPLHGRDATAKGNWSDGRPVRIVAYKVPKEPEKPEAWTPRVLVEDLHVVHNFELAPQQTTKSRAGWSGPSPPPDEIIRYNGLITASYSGVDVFPGAVAEELNPNAMGFGAKWGHAKPWLHSRWHVGDGNQENPSGSRGASEVASSSLGENVYFGFWMGGAAVAIEPWHGNQIVVYTRSMKYLNRNDRTVIDNQLRWGHAVKWLTTADARFIVAGVRDDPNPKLGDTFKDRRGVRLYRNTGDRGENWDRYILDDGGVAVEDLAVGDLDGDGRPDIVAVGRATGNARVYWNVGK